jgi:hypothetical protein
MLYPLSSSIILVACLAITGLGKWDILFNIAEFILELIYRTIGNKLILLKE